LKSVAKDEVYRVANMTTDTQQQFLINLSNIETAATTWSFAHAEQVSNKPERYISGITWNELKWFKMEFSIHLIELKGWFGTIGIQALRKTIEQCTIHFG
jgi:hypothetical protein